MGRQQPLLELLACWERGGSEGIPGVIAHPDDPIPEECILFNDLDSYPIVDRTWLIQSVLRRYGTGDFHDNGHF